MLPPSSTASLLDWRGTHYGGGARCNVAADEAWSKVIGPMFVYVNALEASATPSQADLDALAATAGDPTAPPAWKANATALWIDALEQAKKEAAKWPSDWVEGVDYPHEAGRGTVSGRIALDDPRASTTKLPRLTVGLAPPDGSPGAGKDWAHDAKGDQFWAPGDEDGRFTIPHVRPGPYTLHAFADGVLGEFARLDVAVAAGRALDLGDLAPSAKDPAHQRFGWVEAESLAEYPQSDTTGPWRVYGRGPRPPGR